MKRLSLFILLPVLFFAAILPTAAALVPAVTAEQECLFEIEAANL